MEEINEHLAEDFTERAGNVFLPGGTDEVTVATLTVTGIRQLYTGIEAARVGDTAGAGEAVWEMSEEDVTAGLAILNTMTQALIAQGTNYQLGRHVAAENAKRRAEREARFPQSTVAPRVLNKEEREAPREAAAEDLAAHEMTERALDSEE